MAGILIVAHAPLASALRDCLKHIYCGLPARIGAIDVLPDSDPREVEQLAKDEVERLREANGTLVFADLYGATPANIASRLASMSDVRVLAGVNLPMLLRAVCYRHTPLDLLVDKTLAGGANGIQTIEAAAPCVYPVPPVTACKALPANSSLSSSMSSSMSPATEHHAARRTHHHQ